MSYVLVKKCLAGLEKPIMGFLLFVVPSAMLKKEIP